MVSSYNFQLVTDQYMMADLGFENILLAAIKQGVSLVQLREKTLNTYDFINFAKKIKTLVTKYSIPLIINDRVDVALACDADGVHLGQEDMNIDDARILLGPHKIIGVTIENKYQFYNLSNKKISYFGVSSIYPTTTKSNVANIWSDDDIKEIKKQSQIPLIGIGGIGTGNIKKTLQTGLDGVAVVSAICNCKSLEDVESNTKLLYEALQGTYENH